MALRAATVTDGRWRPPGVAYRSDTMVDKTPDGGSSRFAGVEAASAAAVDAVERALASTTPVTPEVRAHLEPLRQLAPAAVSASIAAIDGDGQPSGCTSGRARRVDHALPVGRDLPALAADSGRPDVCLGWLSRLAQATRRRRRRAVGRAATRSPRGATSASTSPRRRRHRTQRTGWRPSSRQPPTSPGTISPAPG